MSTPQIDVLARTIYGEARGESISGMEAVASVVLNRLYFSNRHRGYWWGDSIIEICKKPWQFSCWNKNDINYQIISNVEDYDIVFCICKRIAARAVAGLIEDKTCNATHYHTLNSCPKWSIGKIPCATIGGHVFYNDIEKE